MAAQIFGKTWWGSEWLKSLTHIDYANRIPRGSAYARKGAVKSIDVKGNVITAKVSGSRTTPYRVTIRVPLFKKEQTELLMKKLLEQPALISKLLNRELAPEVFQVAKRIGLNLFPQRWSDLDMNCSCPDWAVPCKHLAAVIYMMSREIDNDPFLVFSMHGVDLLEELKKRNVEIEKEQMMDVPDICTLFVIKGKADSKDNESDALELCSLATKGTQELHELTLHRVDFTGLCDITEALANLLPSNPSFSQHKDFQQVYAAEMGLLSRKAQRVLGGKLKLGFSRYGEQYDLKRNTYINYLVNRDGAVFPMMGKLSEFDPMKAYWGDHILDSLTDLPADLLSDYDLSVQGMHQVLLCALHLLAKGAVVPKIVKVSDEYDIRWLPAMISDEVAQVVQALDKTLPPNLLTFVTKKGRGLTTVQIENEAECLLSYVLGRLIDTLSNFAEGSVVFGLFFKHYTYPFSSIGEKATPGAIHSWLDRFFLSQRQFHPSLLISENEFGEFALDVAIDRDGEAVLLKDILHDEMIAAQRFTILKELSLLSSLVRGLEMYINRDGMTPIVFTLGEFTQFLFNAIPAIRLLGVKVMLPKSLQDIIRPKVSMKLSKKQTNGKTYLRLDEMLQFDWQVALGDKLVTPVEFEKLTRRATGLIRFKQQYIYVNEQDIERLRKAFNGNRPMSATQMLQAALTESYDRAPIILTDEVRQMIRQLMEQADIPVPQGITAILRPYQERGFSWMYRNFRIGFGSIIADDMGLGKTLQVITLLQKLKDEGALTIKHPALIVVPTGLVTNWQAEIARFAPSLSVFTYHGPQRNLKEYKDTDILLTTYGVLRSDITKLKKLSWLAVIIDLPDKIEQNELALLTERQAALYYETLEQAMQAIEGIEATDQKSLFARQGLVLQMILALKQICNHPALFLKNGDFNPELSGKTEMLLSLLESIVESGQKVLVFTQFREMGDILQQMIEKRIGERPLFLHGGCSIRERQAMVDRFQQNTRGDQIFLLSLKAAGTGLNLTAASHVIHYDLWWNPAVEAQATDRAYRIGQHQNVLVHRFITQNTFEERIDQMIQDKRHLADLTVASGESWIGKLSNSELREIFG